MCSILCILDLKTEVAELRKIALELSKKQRHRGPDWSGIYSSEKAILAHERLAIIDVENGAQPLYNKARTHILAVNGEIYNHHHLRKELEGRYDFQTHSDCEVILALYQEKGVHFLKDLQGIFAFVLYDSEKDVYLIGRDHLGIVPLYQGYDEHGNFYVSSEMKGLSSHCTAFEEFPPGFYFYSKDSQRTRYYEPAWRNYAFVEKNTTDRMQLRQSLEEAVRCQLMSDVPYGVLLSGGLDSSLIAALAKKFVKRRIENQGQSEAWWPQLHTFSIGLEGSPDLKAAREVARYIDSIHHELHFTVQEGIDALSDVIYHIETYDVTTIRASTPMYLMARKIRSMGIKMVLSGEGSDEIFGGYLYFHKAPHPQAFHEELLRKLDRLHWYDCLRANKSMAAWGVEARVPFLDQVFLEVAMSLNPQEKFIGPNRIEKQFLRESFSGYLPESILWRQKEQFSDGVGYSWIDSLKAYAEKEVSDQQLAHASYRFPYNPPQTKEQYLYRELFSKHYPSLPAAQCVPGGPSVACSTAEALAWEKSLQNLNDPSGRAMRNIHKSSY
jgi:asparagine synthase (glutamine-hydrolysing)